MSTKFYFVKNGQQTGPFTLEELKLKQIQRNTLVWTEGLENWTKAENIPLLKDLLRGTPPPVPDSETKFSSQQPPPTPKHESPNFDQKHFGYDLANRRERLFASLFQGLIIGLPLFIFFGNELNDSDPYSLGSIASGAILSALLGALFYPMWGSNLGHKIMGLKVISAEDGTIQANAKTGALREGLKSVFSMVFIPVVWLLWDDNRQNLYDKVVKTYVVKKKQDR